MLSTDLFIEKFDTETLTDEDIRSIPSCFMDEQESGREPVWLPYENGYGFLVFCIASKMRFFIKVKSDNKIFELKYKLL